MNRHVLRGCTPTPLAHYLKGLGVLRLVGEQADPQARAQWVDDELHLLTQLDRSALLEFLAHRYVPSTLLTPWNGGSGFYPKDKAARERGVQPLLNSTAERFSPLRDALHSTVAATQHMSQRPAGEAKLKMQARMHAEWEDSALAWFRSALAIHADGAKYPALLGTGGNDGRLDFTSNYMQRLASMFDPHDGSALQGTGPLESALFGTPAIATSKDAIGQYLPGAAGGANANNGPMGDSTVNTWDFLLLLEGSLMLEVTASRRLDTQGLPQASAPFALHGRAAGYGSAARSEESARGEQWMPLWSAAMTLAETRSLFRAGRMSDGRSAPRSATDAARALGRSASFNRVHAFQRFGFIERNGQSNLAVPLGRWQVSHRPQLEQTALDQLDPWVRKLRLASSDDQRDPESLRRGVRRLEDAVFALRQRGGQPADWQRILVTMANAETSLLRRPRHTGSKRLDPLPALDPAWVSLAAGDHPSPELRLALAYGALRRHGQGWSHRSFMLPINRYGRFETRDEQLVSSPNVVWTHRDLPTDLAHTVQRRLLHEQKVTRGLSYTSAHHAHLDDIHAFADNQLDAALLSGLLRAMAAMADGTAPWPSPPWSHHAVNHPLNLFLLTAHLGQAPDHDPVDTRDMVRQLLSGRIEEASRTAVRRLRGRGLNPVVDLVHTTPETALRWAAALAFPLSSTTVERLLHSLTFQHDDQDRT